MSTITVATALFGKKHPATLEGMSWKTHIVIERGLLYLGSQMKNFATRAFFLIDLTCIKPRPITLLLVAGFRKKTPQRNFFSDNLQYKDRFVLFIRVFHKRMFAKTKKNTMLCVLK